MENNFENQSSRIRNTCFNNRRLKKFLNDLLQARDRSDMSFIWLLNKKCLLDFTKEVQKEFIRLKDVIKENITNETPLRDIDELKTAFQNKLNSAA